MHLGFVEVIVSSLHYWLKIKSLASLFLLLHFLRVTLYFSNSVSSDTTTNLAIAQIETSISFFPRNFQNDTPFSFLPTNCAAEENCHFSSFVLSSGSNTPVNVASSNNSKIVTLLIAILRYMRNDSCFRSFSDVALTSNSITDSECNKSS